MQLDPARAHVLYLEPNLRSPDGHGRNHGSVGPHHVHMDPSVGAWFILCSYTLGLIFFGYSASFPLPFFAGFIWHWLCAVGTFLSCGHLPSPCLCTSFYFSFSGALTLIPLNCR
ncbi:hypothetical protein BC826DRAFT_1023156 [Russula brevipes]|nr:hypothetical protein BC826DRAFT_1023156 [Russula brevipes]